MLSTSAQALGIVIFFSIMGSVFQNRAFAGVSTVLPNVNAQDIHQALAGTSSSFFQSLEEGKRAAVISAVMSAMSSAWAVVLAGGACSFLLSLFLGVGNLCRVALLLVCSLTAKCSAASTMMHLISDECVNHGTVPDYPPPYPPPYMRQNTRQSGSQRASSSGQNSASKSASKANIKHDSFVHQDSVHIC